MIQALLIPEIGPLSVRPVVAVLPPPTMRPAARRTATAPAPARQTGLAMPIGTEVSLVDLQTIRAIRGLDAESVLALIDAGRIRWVWDVSLPNSARRELRFLTAEARGEAVSVTASRAQAIDLAIGVPPTRQRVRAAEIEQRWVVSNQTVMRLGRAGEITVEMEGHTKWVRRDSLARFLARRWAN